MKLHEKPINVYQYIMETTCKAKANSMATTSKQWKTAQKLHVSNANRIETTFKANRIETTCTSNRIETTCKANRIETTCKQSKQNRNQM